MLFGLLKRRTKRYRSPAARERLGPRLLASLVRISLAVLVAVGIGAVAWGGWMLYEFLYESEYFDLRDLEITLVPSPGLETEPNPDFVVGEIGNRLHEAALDQGNLLRLDAKAVRANVKGYSKVLDATVAKHYPRRLTVKATLREVVALVQHDPILAVDRDGFIVQALTTRSAQAHRFPYVTGIELGPVDLGQCLAPPHATGPSADLTKALRLLSSLRQMEAYSAAGKASELAETTAQLAKKISEIHCDNATGDLSLMLLGGTEIRFGSGDPLLRMPALETFLHNQKGEMEQYAYIDLRVDTLVTSKPKTASPQGEGK